MNISVFMYVHFECRAYKWFFTAPELNLKISQSVNRPIFVHTYDTYHILTNICAKYRVPPAHTNDTKYEN